MPEEGFPSLAGMLFPRPLLLVVGNLERSSLARRWSAGRKKPDRNLSLFGQEQGLPVNILPGCHFVISRLWSLSLCSMSSELVAEWTADPARAGTLDLPNNLILAIHPPRFPGCPVSGPLSTK